MFLTIFTCFGQFTFNTFFINTFTSDCEENDFMFECQHAKKKLGLQSVIVGV